MGDGPRSRRPSRSWSLGLSVALLLTGCTLLHQGDSARELEDWEQRDNPAFTMEGRADRFCEAPAEADRAMVLYRLMRRQALLEGDEEGAAWLRDRVGPLLFDLVRFAALADPRHTSLPIEQEPQRPELIALVCARCPATAAATTDLQREVYESPGTLPMCADGTQPLDATPPASVGHYWIWDGVMVTTEVSFEHGPYAPCPPDQVFTYRGDPRDGDPECQIRYTITGQPAEPCQLADAEAGIRALLPHQVEVSMVTDPAQDAGSITRHGPPRLDWARDVAVTMTDDRITMRHEDDQSLWEWQGNLVVDDADQPVAFTGTFRGVVAGDVAIRAWNDHAGICTPPGLVIEAPRGDRATFTGSFEVVPRPSYGD